MLTGCCAFSSSVKSCVALQGLVSALAGVVRQGRRIVSLHLSGFIAFVH